MSVRSVSSDAEFSALVGSAGNKLVVVDFYATWCGPCRSFSPVFLELSSKFYSSCLFLKVDIDMCKETTRCYSVSSVPTFIFIKNGKKVDFFSGADKNRLIKSITTFQDDVVDVVPGYGDLLDFIDKKNMECLNQREGHPVSALLKDDGSYLESDADEQPVKLHSIDVRAPANGQAPSLVRVFVNPPFVPDFDECETAQATQELSLKVSDSSVSLVQLQFVKYQNVNKIVFFIQSNEGDCETTVIRYLRLIGSPVSATNMKAFRRISGEPGEAHE
ncbi:thioredoxin-like protein 1 isoform X2 [Zophobas morio]|uniref:thioredoxin-like protein 1 isoform X2 n=1 Tax=Zophobas morio TaxID=2755281 RepID=UPI003083AD51